MTNFDKWQKVLTHSYFGVNKYTGVPFECTEEKCNVCILDYGRISCSHSRMEWLKEPYEESTYEIMSLFVEEVYNKLCLNDCDSCILYKIQKKTNSTDDCKKTLLRILLGEAENEN